MINAKIIIADDHPIFRSGIKAVVSNLHFISKVAEAGNGEEVIKLLDYEPYDLVLMDIKMEPMGGIEATEIICNNYPSTRVIALSMHDEEGYILEIFEKGAAGYLIKNADKEEIELAVKEVLDGKQYFSKEVSKTLIENIHRLKYTKEKVDIDLIQKQRIKDITFLICNEFTNQEIGDILCLSPRTIEGYRSQIFKATNTTNVVGLIKFSIENKLLEDEDLKKKFNKYLTEKRFKLR